MIRCFGYAIRGAVIAIIFASGYVAYMISCIYGGIHTARSLGLSDPWEILIAMVYLAIVFGAVVGAFRCHEMREHSHT